MTIIKNTAFVSRNEAIPVDELGSILDAYILREELYILSRLLGYQLYKEFDAGFNEPSPVQKWTDLANGADYTYNGVLKRFAGCSSISIAYTFYKYTKENYAHGSSAGIKIVESENSRFADPSYKQSYSLETIEAINLQLREFIQAINNETPDTYENYIPGIYEAGNIWGL